MVRFETFDEVCCVKGSEYTIRKVKEILSFINDNGGKAYLESYPSLVLKDNLLHFGLSVSIPLHSEQSYQ